MHKGDDGIDCFDPDRKILDAVTDSDGVYRFENVVPGGYKLTWLPEGQNRWIRRIALRPDIMVRGGETTRAKEIRVALQTIN
jgi:protocatechuate 3,4-dioxygenase beta subunit